MLRVALSRPELIFCLALPRAKVVAVAVISRWVSSRSLPARQAILPLRTLSREYALILQPALQAERGLVMLPMPLGDIGTGAVGVLVRGRVQRWAGIVSTRGAGGLQALSMRKLVLPGEVAGKLDPGEVVFETRSARALGLARLGTVVALWKIKGQQLVLVCVCHRVFDDAGHVALCWISWISVGKKPRDTHVGPSRLHAAMTDNAVIEPCLHHGEGDGGGW